MTVQELIEQLRKFHSDAYVVILDACGDETTNLTLWDFGGAVVITETPDCKHYTLKYES